MASIIKTMAATISNKFIRFPPMLNIKPINQNSTTKPPNHLRNVIPKPPQIYYSLLIISNHKKDIHLKHSSLRSKEQLQSISP